MEKILEPFIKLLDNPLSDFFQLIGFNEDISKLFTASILAFILWLGKKLYNHFKNIKTAKELVQFQYSYKDVKQKRDLFIPTKAQNFTPTYEEEPKHSTKFIVKKPLISFFIKEVFNEKRETDKFYLILADSGMGKTTFMINLYLKYHSFFNFRRKYRLKLFPFGDKNIMNWIKGIKPEEARDTILLLDAFDEYKALLPPEEPDGLTGDERFRKLLDEIIENVTGFREVVITSRTQYFPGQEDQPYELKIPRFGSEGFHTLAKLYLSPFERKETTSYLNKKYGIVKIWNHRKKRIAKSILENSPKLMVRPMLLSYIDFLVDKTQIFENTYQIYDTLIKKWIEREAAKRKHKSEDREKFKRDLYDFSMFTALEIYKKRKENNLINKEEAKAICDANNINLTEYEIMGQSLLTRDVSHNWKFAHKSILEFFVAKEAVKSFDIYCELVKSNFTGWDMVRVFYDVIGHWIFVNGGTFDMGDDNIGSYTKPKHKVTIPDFYISKTPVTQKQWREVMDNNPSYFKDCDDCPVESVSWNDAQDFINKLNEKTGLKFRLPTESEWEYAARGGNKNKGYKYSGSNNLEEVGWYSGNSESKTRPVAEKNPNELVIHDMSGNVWEWCLDKWHNNYDGAPADGSAREIVEGSSRVLRGGSWVSSAEGCRSAYRNALHPGNPGNFVGFRLVLVP